MTPERWQRVEEIFRAVLDRPSDSRKSFLDGACDDGDVRREVESLLRRRDAPAAGMPAWPVSESLPSGARLGPYEILSQIGAGGMGTVRRARDTRLNRIVAIKICREPVTGRFEREARAIAALNHPHICTLHDLGEHDGVDYLVMEYVEGESLAERLTKGPLPTGHAVRYAIEIADALVAAHARGIVHRDLKPGNIMVTKTGVKVLDFGLAKMPRADTVPGSEVVTHPEIIAGTPQYMSPEQIQGKEVDARSDIFSFGLVLYEMVSGMRAFPAENAASTVAAILEREPLPIEAGELNRVIAACLEKDPNERLQTARDLKRAIEWSAVGSGTIAPASARPKTWIPWTVGSVFAALALLVWLRGGASDATTARLALTITPPSTAPLAPVANQASAPEISPDGSAVMYRAAGGVWVWRLDSLEPQLVQGSKGITNTPFWSADSKTIGFDTTAGLFRIRVPDGVPELITRMPAATRGGSWSENGTILITCQERLYTVPATGGDLKLVDLTPLKPGGHLNPQFLSGSEDFLFLLVPGDTREGEVYLATLRDGKAVNPKFLMKSETSASYTPAGGGRILFVHDNDLYAQKLNRKARTLEGDPELIQKGVASVPGVTVSRASFLVSRMGAVAWRPGRAALNQVTIFDRKGSVIGTAGSPASIQSLALSPDERRLLAYGDAAWLLEPGQSGSLALEKKWSWSAWSPDGSRLLGTRRNIGLGEWAVNSADPIHELGPTPDDTDSLQDVSPDGKYLLLRLGQQVITRRMEEKQGDTVVTQIQKAVICPGFSPDGRWIVYSEGATGATYVQPFPGPGLRTQISSVVGVPLWRRDGKEILILDRTGGLRSVPVSGAGTGIHFATTQLLFSGLHSPVGYNASTRPLAVSHDGSRFYLPVPIEQKDAGVIHVGMGWVK